MPRNTAPASFKENTRLGMIVLAACILISVLVLAPVKLSGARNEAEDIFRNGTEKGITVSVYTDLIAMAENANRLANFASEQLGENNSDIQTLKDSAKKIFDAKNEKTMLEAYSGIALAADNVYTRLTGSAKEDAKGAYVNIDNYVSTIKRDSYFTYAEKFNRSRNSFPAIILAGLFGIDEMPILGK